MTKLQLHDKRNMSDINKKLLFKNKQTADCLLATLKAKLGKAENGIVISRTRRIINV